MKKTINILASFLCGVVACITFSCTKEIDPVKGKEAPAEVTDIPEGYEELTLTAISEDTKTSLDDGDTVWNENDKIKVICSDGTASDFTLQSGANTTSGDFRGLVPSGKTALYAVYPKDANASSGTTLKVTIPATQTGSFGSGNIAVAQVAEGTHNMAFKNVNAFLSITTTAAIHHIVVTSVDGSNLVGTIPVTFSSGNAVPGTATSTAASVRLNTSNTAGTYYISILPGVTHNEGLTIAYYSAESALVNTYYLRKKVVAAQNKIIEMGAFVPNGKNYYVTTSGKGNKSGIDWNNAMDATKLKTLVTPDADDSKQAAKIAAINGAAFHLGAGNYDFGSDPTINFSSSVTLTFKGGYPTSPSNGATQNLASYKANFTGDNSHVALKLRGKLNVTFEGIGFINGKMTKFDDQGDSGTKGAGSLDVLGNSKSDMTVTMINCLVDGNKNDSYSVNTDVTYIGAGIFLKQCTLSATNVTFSNNDSYSASALVVWQYSSATLNNCTFSGNRARSEGAGIYLYYDGSATISGGSFSNNSAGTNGGAIKAQQNAALTCSKVTFTGNTAGNNGGAVALWGASTKVFKGCTFGGSDSGAPNHASAEGGAFYVAAGGLTIQNSDDDIATTFRGNYSANGGGAIYFKSDGTLSCTKAAFNSNYSSTGRGGAIYHNRSDNCGTVYVDRCSFVSNHAGKGGALASYAANTMYINGCSFRGDYITDSSDQNGTTINFERSVKFGMNNCSIHYDTTGPDSADRRAWVYLQGGNSEKTLEKYTISNSALIATSSSPIASSSYDQQIVYILNAKSSSYYGAFINNIIINDGTTNRCAWWLNMAYVNGYNNVFSPYHGISNGGKNGAYVGTADTDGKTSSYFNGLKWKNDTYWYFDSSGGYNRITPGNFDEYLENSDPAFKTWLTDIGQIHNDQTGAARRTDTWPVGPTN